MNAVAYMVSRLPSDALRRLAALRPGRFDAVALPEASGAIDARGSAAEGRRGSIDADQAAARVIARWDADLCGLLNALVRDELVALADELRVRLPDARAPELRAALWDRGAAIERGTAEVSPQLQPRPVVLAGSLILQAPPRGLYPPSAAWPRPVPDAVAAVPPADEPDTVDDLLAAADRLLGVRLGARGRDKGAWGLRAARLLGILERNDGEPDWRGDIEVKTIPVAREPGGLWRVVEDPAIAMAGEPVLAKLARTLWLARADVEPDDATIVAWYLLDWDPTVARLARRYLHERPKGPAGTDARASYLHRRFFADAGLLATLNGPP